MRGVPLHPVTCSKCGSIKGYPKDGLCNRCRIASRQVRVFGSMSTVTVLAQKRKDCNVKHHLPGVKQLSWNVG